MCKALASAMVVGVPTITKRAVGRTAEHEDAGVQEKAEAVASHLLLLFGPGSVNLGKDTTSPLRWLPELFRNCEQACAVPVANDLTIECIATLVGDQDAEAPSFSEMCALWTNASEARIALLLSFKSWTQGFGSIDAPSDWSGALREAYADGKSGKLRTVVPLACSVTTDRARESRGVKLRFDGVPLPVVAVLRKLHSKSVESCLPSGATTTHAATIECNNIREVAARMHAAARKHAQQASTDGASDHVNVVAAQSAVA